MGGREGGEKRGGESGWDATLRLGDGILMGEGAGCLAYRFVGLDGVAEETRGVFCL